MKVILIMTANLNIMIKPASSICNLSCKYCFYHSLSEKRLKRSYGYMDIDLLEKIVKKGLTYAGDTCTFAFQGGEPTLAGLKFYKKLIEFELKYNFKNLLIINAIQTNGINGDEEWAKFLSENRFLVGISLDGPREIHDTNRIDNQGKGTFKKVMETINLLNKYKVEYNILTVITSMVARHTNKVYNFFKNHNFQYLQFIPCLDLLDEEIRKNDYSLKSDKYAYFLKTLFDLWYDDIFKGNIISIQYFDNLLGLLMGYKPEVCGMAGQCTCQFIIEANGGVYPCDFYVTDQWYLGNIKESNFNELLNSTNSKRFVEVSRYIEPECKLCRWHYLCRGGCRRWREPFIYRKPRLNILCSAYKKFFNYSEERLIKLAQQLKAERTIEQNKTYL